MTRYRLLKELDAREIVEWDAFFQIEYETADLHQKEAMLEREAIADLRRNR
ncbi:MAG: hypothetical protein WBR15_02790 [Gammaproteobacteria bacterium]